MGIVLLIILILLLIAVLPTWPYSSGWGYYPTGGLGTILLILIILWLLGVIYFASERRTSHEADNACRYHFDHSWGSRSYLPGH